ncbi:MAG: IS21 family transposase [Candidatus Izemoplasmatales bacterium]
MRKDILEFVERMKKEGIRPNYSLIARRYNCDYRTVKKYYENEEKDEKAKKKRPSKLDKYKEVIKEKVEYGVTGSEICRFIKKKGYLGQYTILRDYVKEIKGEMQKKATIRFETNPGLQAQVDWKERMKLISKNGEIYTVDIFLMILGYSRLKYIELTINKEQETLFSCLANAFQYFDGVPQEILFDNMRTVIDQSRTRYQEPVINSKFYHFSKDMGFEVRSCIAYRPQTKGKVEALAKLVNNLKVYNNEFEDYEELTNIVKNFNEELNLNISLATNEIPWERFEKEKEYLNPLPNQELLLHFHTRPIVRKVSKESMITYNKSKYSVPTKYIGKLLTVKEENSILHIYYNKELINSHKISKRKFNYRREDMIDILESDAFKHYNDEEIENYINQNISIYDYL